MSDICTPAPLEWSLRLTAFSWSLRHGSRVTGREVVAQPHEMASLGHQAGEGPEERM